MTYCVNESIWMSINMILETARENKKCFNVAYLILIYGGLHCDWTIEKKAVQVAVFFLWLFSVYFTYSALVGVSYII